MWRFFSGSTNAPSGSGNARTEVQYKDMSGKYFAEGIRIEMPIDYPHMVLNTLIIIFFIAASLLISMLLAGNTILNNKIFPAGTLVNGHDIGGLSFSEGTNLVLTEYKDELKAYSVTLYYGDAFIKLDAKDLQISNCIEDLLYNASYSTYDDESLAGVSTILHPKHGSKIDISPLLDLSLVQKTLQNALLPDSDPNAATVQTVSHNMTGTTSSVDETGNLTVYLTVNSTLLNKYVSELSKKGQTPEQKEQDLFEQYLTPELLQYRPLIEKYSKQNDLDPDYVTALMYVESTFNPSSESHAGALGLMQILPLTGEWIAGQLGISDYSTEMLFDPEFNIYLGCWYVSYLLDFFNGDIHTATIAYNAGPIRVLQWLEDENYSSDGVTLHTIPYQETKAHTDQIETYYEIYKNVFKA